MLLIYYYTIKDNPDSTDLWGKKTFIAHKSSPVCAAFVCKWAALVQIQQIPASFMLLIVFFVCCCCLSLAVIFKWEQLVCAWQTCSSVCHYFSFFMQYINADITYVHILCVGVCVTHTHTQKKTKYIH